MSWGGLRIWRERCLRPELWKPEQLLLLAGAVGGQKRCRRSHQRWAVRITTSWQFPISRDLRLNEFGFASRGGVNKGSRAKVAPGFWHCRLSHCRRGGVVSRMAATQSPPACFHSARRCGGAGKRPSPRLCCRATASGPPSCGERIEAALRC